MITDQFKVRYYRQRKFPFVYRAYISSEEIMVKIRDRLTKNEFDLSATTVVTWGVLSK